MLKPPMTFKAGKLSLNFVISSALLVVSLPTLAMTGDSKQPIHIESNTQLLDMKGNVVIFTGNVVMAQGSIKINADKVVLTRPGGEQGKEIIDGYGNPSTFFQIQENGKPMKGRASHMHYELARDLVILTGNAYLEQLNSNIISDQITYLVKEKKMQAYSEKGKRVVTVLLPSQLQDKNKDKGLSAEE